MHSAQATWPNLVGGDRPIARTLRRRAEVDAAQARLREAGARLHADPVKNWDLELFLARIEHLFPRSAAVLDVGCAGNPLLYNLAQRGHSALWGIDFDLAACAGMEHPAIQYVQGDLLKTPMPDASFDCITSVSVVEHGVDLDHYLTEMARLLRPGGRLLTSTDFWRWPVTSRGLPAELRFDLPWRAFTPGRLRRLVRAARRHGLEPAAPIDTRVEDRVVWWHGKRYTFVAFEFVRAGKLQAG